MKRYNEIKAGVITGCVGMSVSVVLFVLMNGIILSGKVTPGAAEILSRIWIAGVIPLFVGIALVINGLFVSKKLVELAKRESWDGANRLEDGMQPKAMRPADTSEFIPSGFSVTEETTMHLRGSSPKQ